MKIGQRARRVATGEIRAQPLLFLRPRLATADRGALTIQHDDVPRTQFVTEVALRRISGGRAEIAEIICGAGRVKLVVPDCGPCARFHLAPGLVVAREILLRAIRVGQVAHRHHRAKTFMDDFPSGF